MSISIGPALVPDQPRSVSELRWADVAGKRVFMLRQRGSLADISYDHGQLLAAEIEDGVFPEIVDTIRTGTDADTDAGSWVLNAVYRRLSDGVFDACPGELRIAIDALGEGMFDRLSAPRFTPRDVRDALVAIETGNCAEALTRRLDKPLAAEAWPTFEYVIGAIRRHGSGSLLVDALRFLLDKTAAGRQLRRLRAQDRRVGFGCTAAGAGPAQTADGRGLHARTFDGAFFDWNRYPGVMIVDERRTNPDWHRYVAVGTAGLIYSGGISGLNDQGIACSIHQMSTANDDTGRPGQGYVPAPFLQQRILREAASIEDAAAILGEARHFSAWTIVVSDATSGRAARFEISARDQRAVRTDLGARFAQSNHFLDPAVTEANDHFGDAHFTPTFGKWLESRARLSTVESAFTAGRPGTDWAIGLLAGHGDEALGGRPRSFGRTVCRAYGLMGSVARTDPDRTRAADEIWFSTGDRAPGPHAHFVGFAIDWEALTLTPVATMPVRAPCTVSAAFSGACAEYVAAFRTMARPRGEDGYLGRDPTEAEQAACRASALDALDRACEQAENAGETDFAFRYARARLRHDAGDFAGAEADWQFLRQMADGGGAPVHDWERALVMILSGATALAADRPGASEFLDAGEAAMAAIRQMYFRHNRAHPDLDAWAEIVHDLRETGTADLPELEFVTVE